MRRGPRRPADESLRSHPPAPTSLSTLRASVSIPFWNAPISSLVADASVRRAFERAEREDGTGPNRERRCRGGAEARKELADA
jgi:hypothetical protein